MAKALRGFTLIELMIVIMLLGLVMSLVGPLTFQQVETARARSEQENLKRWLRQQSFFVYSRKESIELDFDGKALYLKKADGSRETLKQFNYLFFPPQQIRLNINGFPHPSDLSFIRLQQKQKLDLFTLLASPYEQN